MTGRPNPRPSGAATVWRPALRVLALLGMAGLLVGAAEIPQQPAPLDAPEAARQGRAIVAELLAQRPVENSTNTGTMRIRAKRKSVYVPVTFIAFPSASGWINLYAATNAKTAVELTITHEAGGPSQYQLTEKIGESRLQRTLVGDQTMQPFAGSDFWIADLGLEFFHWPEQRLVKREMISSRPCRVIESLNPEPAPGAYSRVVSWIDDENGGIIHADAYDFQGKLLKQFNPKGVKKVNGQWELEGMEILNRQTDSSTRIEFHLDTK